MGSLNNKLTNGEGEFAIKGEAGNLRPLYEKCKGNVKLMSKITGCSYKTLRECLIDLNLPPRGLRGSPISESDAENIVDLFKKYNCNVKKVHEETGFSDETIRRHVYKSGQEPRFIHLSDEDLDLIVAGHYVFDGNAAMTAREIGKFTQMTVLRYWKIFGLESNKPGSVKSQ